MDGFTTGSAGLVEVGAKPVLALLSTGPTLGAVGFDTAFNVGGERYSRRALLLGKAGIGTTAGIVGA
ncbi:hypothetical protein [Micromonospora avicenniae]|uniref:hypothetical protein n=1 Tax=Micromonospora avicenniae TaxID=1198245 RepID=UPI0034186598